MRLLRAASAGRRRRGDRVRRHLCRVRSSTACCRAASPSCCWRRPPARRSRNRCGMDRLSRRSGWSAPMRVPLLVEQRRAACPAAVRLSGGRHRPARWRCCGIAHGGGWLVLACRRDRSGCRCGSAAAPRPRDAGCRRLSAGAVRAVCRVPPRRRRVSGSWPASPIRRWSGWRCAPRSGRSPSGLLLAAHADRFGTTQRRRGDWRRRRLAGARLSRRSSSTTSIAAAGALALALLATWNLPPPTPEMNFWVFRLQPDHVANFTTPRFDLRGAARRRRLCRVAAGRAAGALGSACRQRRRSLILIIAYWRLQKFELQFAWTLMALALAGAGARRRGRGRQAPHGRIRDRDRARRLCGRRARRHDHRGRVRAWRGLADRGAGGASAGDRLGRDPHPGRRRCAGSRWRSPRPCWCAWC